MFDSAQRQEILRYSKAPRPTLWPTHPCIQLIQAGLTAERETDHSPEVPRLEYMELYLRYAVCLHGVFLD